MYKVYRHIILAAYIVACSCLEPLEDVDNADEARIKRSLWGGAKPTGKTCLNFCNAVSGICGHGHCEIDRATCAIRCKCDPGYSGTWCSEMVDSGMSSPSSYQGVNSTVSPPVLKSNPTTPTSENIHSTTESIPSNISTAEVETGNVTESTVTMNNTMNAGNESRATTENTANVAETTESILNRSGAFDSLAQCETKCTTGQCLNLNGNIRCFPISNKTATEKASSCRPGFSCEHGECEIHKNNIIFCRCERNWIGDLCHQHCPLDCGPHGYCSIVDHTSNLPGCNCDPEYTGPRCEELRPIPLEEEEVRHWYAIGVCVAVLFILLVMMIILPYWMWRRRMLFIMKIVHYFQDYEEDDGKEYDAFISYKSSDDDQKFVLEQLYPKLEKEMGFKLCMHFRDFIPGDVIANNIIRAIENSRRTIMVLSPNYIDSEWCRLEYQKAQHEMLKLKHKIIPVVLSDISKCQFIDKNLKTILNTVTYLEWPGFEQSRKVERFWKHLQLSMPKKHSTSSSESLPSIVVSSSPSQQLLLSGSSLSLSETTDDSNITCLNTQVSSALSPSNSSSNENPKGRLQRIKEIIKLTINTDRKSTLHRESSVDSCSSTPITTTPSPGIFLVRDNSPLIKNKTQAKIKETKSSTWSPRSHKDSGIQGLTQHNSLREADKRSIIDVIPQCCLNNQGKNLPDLCRTSDGGYLNIVCEAESPPPSPEDNIINIKCDTNKRTDCPTCIQNCDVDNNNVIALQRTISLSSTDDNTDIEEDNRQCKILGMNIPASNGNTKILNIGQTYVCFCNNKNCASCNRADVNNSRVQTLNTSVSVEDNCIIDLPIPPARKKRHRSTVLGQNNNISNNE